MYTNTDLNKIKKNIGGMLGVLCILALSFSPILAEDKVLEQINVTAKKDNHKTDLDITEVRESAAPDIGEAIQNVPGMNKIRKGSIANDILLRGLQRDNVNVLVDGQRIYGACPNRMDPPAFHVDFGEVDKIEITKGPYDVRNAGSMGGLVEIQTKAPKPGLHSEGNVSISSFGRTDNSVTGSFGSDHFDILAGGAYHESGVYRDGNGNRYTSSYADYYNEHYIHSAALAQNPKLNQIVNMAPHKFPHVYKGSAPSPNRYRYSDRDKSAYEMRSGWSRFAIKPSENHKVEVSVARQEADDVMYPYLMMDGNYDNMTRGSISYTGKDLGDGWKELKIQGYSSYVDHYMTDEMRCSSQFNDLCEFNKERPYSMSTQANTRTNGAKLESGFELLGGLTTMGLDGYERNWRASTITRSMHMSSPMSSSMMMAPMMTTPSYRSQESIPDVLTTNYGAFLEQENKFFDDLKVTIGMRYDENISKAGKDRRHLYNVYYPEYGDPYFYRYQSVSAMQTNFDQEFYYPNKPPSTRFSNSSGYLKLDWEINKQSNILAGYGYGVRTPDPQELYFALQRMGTRMMPDYVGNPNLKETYNSQGDLGYKYFDGNFMLKVNAYYAYLYDYIIPVEMSKNTGYFSPRDPNELAIYKAWTGKDASMNNRYARTYKNVDAVMYGGELEAMLALPEQFYLGTGGGYTRGINDSDDRELPEMPPLKGYLRLKYDDNVYMAEVEGEFAATQTKVDDRIGETKTAGWGIANLKTSYHNEGLKFMFMVRNIFDRQYHEHLSYSRQFYSSGVQLAEPGRSMTLSMQWKF